jgi:hypothetical protein
MNKPTDRKRKQNSHYPNEILQNSGVIKQTTFDFFNNIIAVLKSAILNSEY